MTNDTQNISPIPHGGEVRRPSTDDAIVRRKLAQLALQSDESSVAAWAAAHHKTINASDRAIAEERLLVLQKHETARGNLISRYDDEQGAAPLIQCVVTNEKIAPLNGADRVTSWSSVVWVLMLKAAEAFLVSRYIINSGVFGLNPSDKLHTVFACAYALLPLGAGLCWSLYLARLTGRAQVKACDSLHAKMRFWIPVWVLVFAFVIGPHMITIVPVDDPYDVTSSWVTTTKALFAGIQDSLQAATGLTIIGLLISSLIATSAIIATMLVNNRQTNTAAHLTLVRKDETFSWHSNELAKLRGEEYAASSMIGQMKGFVMAVDDDQKRFVTECQTTVQAFKHQGQMAAGKAILAYPDDTNVIPISATH